MKTTLLKVESCDKISILIPRVQPRDVESSKMEEDNEFITVGSNSLKSCLKKTVKINPIISTNEDIVKENKKIREETTDFKMRLEIPAKTHLKHTMVTTTVRSIIAKMIESIDCKVFEIKKIGSTDYYKNLDEWEQIPFTESGMAQYFTWATNRMANQSQSVALCFTITTDAKANQLINTEIHQTARNLKAWLFIDNMNTPNISEIGFLRDFHVDMSYRLDTKATLEYELDNDAHPYFEIIHRVIYVHERIDKTKPSEKFQQKLQLSGALQRTFRSYAIS